MNPTFEFSLAAAMVLVLLALGGYFGWRQIQTLRTLPALENLTREDRRYILSQAWIRLTSCLLLVVFAGMLAGTYLSGQERHGRELTQLKKDDQALTDEQKQFVRDWIAYWLIMLLVLFVIVSLAFYDLFSIRRFGRRHYRKIQEDRRAMIERQVALMRTQRNGHDGSL